MVDSFTAAFLRYADGHCLADSYYALHYIGANLCLGGDLWTLLEVKRFSAVEIQ